MRYCLPKIFLSVSVVAFLLFFARSTAWAAPTVDDLYICPQGDTPAGGTCNSNLTIVADGDTGLPSSPHLYTITIKASNLTGPDNGQDIDAAINLSGSNSIGYFRWSKAKESSGSTWLAETSCGGPSDGYGYVKNTNPHYVSLVGCSTSVLGNQRTVNFDFFAATDWGSNGPLSGNTISGYAKGGGNSGSVLFALNFNVQPNPRIEMRRQGTAAWSDGRDARNNPVAAVSLDFGTITEGSSSTAAQVIELHNAVDNGSTLNWAAGAPQYSSGSGWLRVGPPTSGSSSGTGQINTLTIGLQNTASLAPGNYTATIQISDPWANNDPVAIDIRLSVSSSCVDTSPDSPTLSSPANGAAGVAVNPTLNWNGTAGWGINCAGNNNRYNVYLSSNQSWVNNENLNAWKGRVGEATTSFAISGLSYSTTYYWKIVADNGALDASSAVWSFTTGPPPAPILNVFPTVLNFSATQGGSNPSSQGVSVWNSGGGTLSWTASDDQSWLTIVPSSFTGNSTTLWSSVDISGLAAGSYIGTITVTGAAGVQNSPQTITVNLTINPPACTDTAPDSPTLSSPADGATGVAIDPTVSWNGIADWGINCAGNNDTYEVFLDTNPAPSTSRGVVTSATTSLPISGLANSTTYYWKVRASNGALTADSPVWSFTTEAIAVPAITATPSSLTFTAINVGDSSTESKTFDVWNSGDAGSTLNWTASETATWFGIDVVSGSSTGPADKTTVTVTLENTSTLSAGSYSETVAISDPNASNDPQTVTVNLTVSSPPVLNVSPLTITFTPITQGESSAQTLSTFVWNSGGGTLSWNAVEGSSWFVILPSSGDSTGFADGDNIWVTLNNTSVLPVGTYTETITVSGQAGTLNSPQTITVNLTIVAPTGTITGFVWEDTGATGDNGIWDVGEGGYLTSVTVNRDNPATSTSTNPADGSYTFGNVPVGVPITVSVSGYPAGWHVTGSCVDGVGAANCSDAAISRTVTLSSSGEVKEVHFGVSDNPSGWFQVKNGDVFANSLSVSLPADPPGAAPGFERWFLDADPTPTAGGVAITNSATLAENTADRVSQRPTDTPPGWKIPSYGEIPWPPEIDDIYADSGLIDYETSFTITAANAASFAGKVLVAESSIIISGDVNQIDALLISKGTITVEDGGVGDDTLVVNGGLYAKGQINIDRKLADNKKPALQVNYNPFFLLQNIAGLTRAPITWKEVR
jgi:hypothetical protein